MMLWLIFEVITHYSSIMVREWTLMYGGDWQSSAVATSALF